MSKQLQGVHMQEIHMLEVHIQEVEAEVLKAFQRPYLGMDLEEGWMRYHQKDLCLSESQILIETFELTH